jgi:hypothetical protein
MITLLKFPGQSIDKILENPNISHNSEKENPCDARVFF